MNGLLHRLAQRANGTARLVRATAVVPAGLVSLQGEALQPTPVHAGWDASASPQPEPGDALEQPDAAGIVRIEPRVAAHLSMDDRADDRSALRRANALAVSARAPSAGRLEQQADRLEQGTGVPPAQTSTPPSPVRSPVASRQDQAPDPAWRERQPRRQADGEANAFAAMRRDPAGGVTATTQVQPLLGPVVPPRAPSAAVAAVHPRAPAHARRAEETTEVHVSIGRIEVTALQQAPAPRKVARQARAPLSLEDYLARRKEQTP